MKFYYRKNLLFNQIKIFLLKLFSYKNKSNLRLNLGLN